MDNYVLPTTAIAGSIYLSKNIDTTKDIVVTFDFACYGPNVSGSEGFCVYFYNSFAGFLSGGGAGPGLCYAPVYNLTAYDAYSTPVTGFVGVNYAVLGVGFDLTGNFATSAYCPNGYADNITNSVVIRDAQERGFNVLYRSQDLSTLTANPISFYQQITGSDVPIEFYRSRIRLTDFCSRIVVDILPPGASDFINYIDTTVPRVVWPNNVNCCLGFSTGLDVFTNLTIKNFNVNGVFTSVSANDVSTTWTYSAANYLGQIPNPATLTVRDTIKIVNAPPWNYYPSLINISQIGSAPFINTDGYINIVYQTQ